MLLVIFWGFIVTLASVSGDCNICTSNLTNFDWNKFTDSRLWYVLLHGSSDKNKIQRENNFDCLVFKFVSLDQNRNSFTTDVYDIREQHHITQYAIATKWNSTGYFETSHPLSMWKGQCCVIAIDYDRYFILKTCSFELNELNVYVGYRSSHPDEAIKKDVLNVLEANNINVKQLVEWKANHCEQEESTKAEGTST